MTTSIADYLSRGSFSFLRADREEIRRIFPTAGELLPEPQPIFLEKEDATPLNGFPIRCSKQLDQLRVALVEYLDAEEDAQVAFHERGTFDSRGYAERWERYRQLLAHTMSNVTISNHGRCFPGLFWLFHSQHIAQRFKELPKRLLRDHLQTAREHGDTIKYRVLTKLTDRVVALCFDIANRLSSQLDEGEDSLFPQLLAVMRDNVLILTEDHISPDLRELASYFQGCLAIDGRRLRKGLQALEPWLQQQLNRDPTLKSAVVDLLGEDPQSVRRLLTRSGFVRFLSRHPAYDPKRLLPLEHVQVWESLLIKLKEFEILHALRKMIVLLETEDGGLVSRDRSTNTTWVGGPPVLRISPATRPIHFMAPGVVDPVVQRYGLVYDITDFSSILSMLNRAERAALEHAFRTTFNFQRKVNKLATSLRLRLEKYLGDGAFYSGRQAPQTLLLAIYVQRFYRQELKEGFPFDSGLRLAINFGEYRLLPLDEGSEKRRAHYEFFGQGLVELSRLSTGKKTQEIEDFKTYLISQGYPESAVNRFFAPMTQKNEDLVSKHDEALPFYAYINKNRALINEGIVATEPFIRRLGTVSDLRYARDDGRGYIAMEVQDETVGHLLVGIRKLGVASFKGLDPLPVYEIVDGELLGQAQFKQIPHQDLMAALERLFATTVTRQLNQRD